MLLKEFLEPHELSQNALAMKIGVPATRIADIVHGRRAVSADTALRLGSFFKTSPEFWLNLQQAVDLYETGYTPQVIALTRCWTLRRS